MKEYLEAVFGADVTPEQIMRVVDLVDEEQELDDPAPPFIVIIREFSGTLTPQQITAITFRMEALSRLIDGRKLGNWTIDVLGKKHVLVPEAVLVATAQAKLIVAGEKANFDPKEFLELALKAAEAEGRA